MKLPVIIMAAGRGTRMRELTAHQPKHLINVLGRPFLSYLLDNLISAGFKDFYLVIGYQAAAGYDFVSNYKNNSSIKVINQFERLGEDKYGTLMPLVAVEKELNNQEVLVVSGDNLYSASDLKKMGGEGSAVAGFPHKNPERFGVLVPKGDNILDYIVEKPEVPPSDLVNCGLYHFSKNIWPILSQVKISPRGEYELTDAVSRLAKQEEVEIVRVEDYWLDFGRPEDVAVVESLLRNQNK
ncbi:MAG: sugar phosphate nucleotidyltransferase [Patescibacteria group bacterium]